MKTSTNTIHMIAPRGNTIAVTAAGSGVPIILLHGFPLDYRMWHGQLADLSRNFQLLAIHFRGFGQSTMDDDGFGLTDLADDVDFVRQHLCDGKRIALIGLSMGGYVALEYWRRYSSQLAALILANTKPDVDTAEARQARLAMAEAAIKNGSWHAVSGMLPRMLAEQTFRMQPEVAQVVETMMRDARPLTVAAAQKAMAAREDFRESLTRIKCPTLVLTGQHDVISPVSNNQRWSAEIPNSKLEIIPNCGHLPPLEDPQAFNRSISNFIEAATN